MLFCFLAVLVSGCATWNPIKAGKTEWKSGDFFAELPEGWHKSSNAAYFLYLTNDGPYLQNISISKERTNKELPNSKKKITEGMLLEEVSDIVLDEMRLNKSFNNFELSENKPASFGETEAFRLTYTFTNDEYVKFKVIHYGFIHKKKYYEIRFQATTQHNLDKYDETFESFISSFKVEKM